MLHLAPGDLLILRFLKLDNQPCATYTVVSVYNDRLPPECYDEPTFWYYHPRTRKLNQMNVRTITDAVASGEIEIVDVLRTT